MIYVLRVSNPVKHAIKLLTLLTFLSLSAVAQSNRITLEDIFKKGVFAARSLASLPSMKDGKSYISIRLDNNNVQYLSKNSYSSGQEIAALFKQSDLIYQGDTLEIGTEFSDDETKVLLSRNEEPMFRYSVKAEYFVYDLKTKKLQPLSSSGKQMLATFSPDGSKVAFVRDNNLYIRDLNSDTELAITTDGKWNHIINGRPDWVYEEEFEFQRAFFWSPDGSKIAYYKFNETAVPEYSMTMFEGLYPTEYRYKYPKAGEKNSEVDIYFYDLKRGRTTKADIGHNKDQYIPRIRWTHSQDQLCILRMNRHQNELDYLLTNANTGSSKLILQQKDERYIEIEHEKLTFLPNGKQFINVSDEDGYKHIYLYDISGKQLRQVTRGNWEVTELYGLDEKNGIIYYQSTERSPLQRDVYSINLKGGSKTRLNSSEGTNDATFSSDYSYFILSNSSINRPPVITLNSREGKVIRLLEDNRRTRKALEDYKINPATFFTFKTSENISLNGYMIKPDLFDATKKYPVIMYVYGGPGSQMVADVWAGSRSVWLRMLAQQGYLVVCVDNRGTGYRGSDFQKSTYKQLGKLETIDQIEAARWLSKQSYVDASRIGIWGWSYGGYLSSLCITRGADVFKMAIAVAPVTTWRFYDTIYTERYLQTPQENAEGYDQNSPINYAGLMKGKFLLIHGTGDDNVHFQNSVMFSEALIQANKAFEQAYYPNKAHGISGGNSTFHLYNRLTNFILNNL